jgi:hypothetical protein
VEHGELVALVLEEPRVGRDVQLEPVGRRGGVHACHVPLRDSVLQDDEAAGLVRRLLP